MLNAVVPDWMNAWGIACFGAAVVLAAIIQRGRVLRLIAILVCLAFIAIRETAIVVAPRSLVSKRSAMGAWSQQYGEGVADMAGRTLATSKYILVSGVGLALLALGRSRKLQSGE